MEEIRLTTWHLWNPVKSVNIYHINRLAGLLPSTVLQDCNQLHHLGVSKNSGTPKWMVKIMENPMNKWDDLGGNPLFLETPISIQSKETDPYDHLTVLPESSRADLSSLNFNKADLKITVTPRRDTEAWKKLPVSAVFKTKHKKQNGGYLLQPPWEKIDQSTCILIVLKFFFSVKTIAMFQNNTFGKWSLCDNASVSTFASVSCIDPCQVSSHHGIISIMSFHYFPRRTIAMYGCLLLVREVLAAAVGSLSAVFPTPYIPEN